MTDRPSTTDPVDPVDPADAVDPADPADVADVADDAANDDAVAAAEEVPAEEILAALEADLLEGDAWATRAEILASPCPVPRAGGVYAAFVDEVPPGVPAEGCRVRDGFTLLYIGVSPARDASAKATLRSRVRQHCRGNASASTLRLSLGCLLADSLGITLRRVGARRHFGPDEARLDAWLDEHLRMSWGLRRRPWAVEAGLVERLATPLNIAGNAVHPFARELTRTRRTALEAARHAAPIDPSAAAAAAPEAASEAPPASGA